VYRSIQLLIMLLNQCIGELLLPILLLFCSSMAVLMGFALIHFELDGFYFVIGLSLGLFLVFVIRVFIGQSANVLRLNEQALENRRRSTRDPSMQRFLRSCPVLRINIGPFFPLKKSTVSSIYAKILEYTVTVLLI